MSEKHNENASYVMSKLTIDGGGGWQKAMLSLTTLTPSIPTKEGFFFFGLTQSHSLAEPDKESTGHEAGEVSFRSECLEHRGKNSNETTESHAPSTSKEVSLGELTMVSIEPAPQPFDSSSYYFSECLTYHWTS